VPARLDDRTVRVSGDHNNGRVGASSVQLSSFRIRVGTNNLPSPQSFLVATRGGLQ